MAAIYALLVRAGRRDALLYLHVGWMSALATGGVTWIVAAYAIAMSGATREVTEGVSALSAAALLLYVGFWMHGKSQAEAWQAYLDRRLRARSRDARSGPSASCPSSPSTARCSRRCCSTRRSPRRRARTARCHSPAASRPAPRRWRVLGWLVIRGSLRLPLGLFFRASAIALAVLAVVLAGKGIVALQEAGWVPVHEVRFPTWPLVGVYPNLQSLLLQAALILLIGAGFAYSRRTTRRAS